VFTALREPNAARTIGDPPIREALISAESPKAISAGEHHETVTIAGDVINAHPEQQCPRESKGTSKLLEGKKR
jgi:hypothetical protein